MRARRRERESRTRRPDLLFAGLLLAGLALLVYAPALNGRFLWDDDAHVTRPELQSLVGLCRIWVEPGATQQFYPLLHSIFWLLHRLWGDAVFGYHLFSVLLHATSAVLLLGILRRLKVPGAGLAAAIFVAHPLMVESVAWISELKNTLSLALCLGALLAYLRFDEERSPRQYAAASALFVLGLLTKTVVAALPGALLVIFWWQRGSVSWRRDVLPLMPWLGLGVAAGLLTASVERTMLGAEGAAFNWTAAERLVLAGRAAWFYVGKLLWPSGLLFVYPRWQLSAVWPWPLVPLSVAVTVAVCWTVRRTSRAPLAIALLYLGTLAPALGFVNVYPFVFSFVADHFAYAASLPIITGFAALVAHPRVTSAGVRPVVATAILVVLSLLTWQQCHAYADPATLYRTTLDGNPACFLCLNNLGTLALERGDVDEAAARFEAALLVEPGSAEVHNNLAGVLAGRGDLARAIDQYRQSLALAPRNVVARTNLGIVLVRAGRLVEARGEFEEALRVMPEYAPAAHNLEVLRRAGI